MIMRIVNRATIQQWWEVVKLVNEENLNSV